jgi:hypothetical protein
MFAILALLGLHGCTTVEDPFLEGMTGSMPVSTGNRELPVHLASASLTGLGEAPLSLRQTTLDGVTTQVLVYSNMTTISGENALTVSTRSSSKASFGKGPDRREITDTLRRDFPGVAMAIDPVIRRNAYGSFGVATGKLGAEGGCVSAWQMIGQDRDAGRDEPLQVRLRYCHPRLAPDVLADLLVGLTLRGSASTPPPPLSYAYSTPSLAAASATRASNVAITPEVNESKDTASEPLQADRDEPSGPAVSIPMPE